MNHYTLIEEKQLPDTGSFARLLQHNQTGARVLLLDNDDENRTFSIGFRTPPKDSTGVAHIVEHSVLSGSKKFKTREPFMDLIQTSLQTFLNAMTYPDKTLYPVSSRHPKDFQHLCEVYLDAVFFPAMVERPEIFWQEGWHLECDEEVHLHYNGVVFNEMKGALSDPTDRLSSLIPQYFHPGSTYGHESGGNPANIVDLTYEDFLSFHERYYHPSNSYIYLYGAMEKEPLLEWMHEEYLSKFEQKTPNSFPTTNPPFSEVQHVRAFYPTDEETDRDTFYSYTVSMGQSEDATSILLRDLLAILMTQSEAAFVKEAFLAEEFGEEIYTETSSSHPLDFSIIVKNAPKDQEERFLSILRSAVEKKISEGFDEEEILSRLRRMEFRVRRGDGPHQGIIYYLRAMNAWLYDASPFEGLDLRDAFQSLYDAIGTSFYEDLLKRLFLEEKNVLVLTMDSDKSLQERERKEEEDRLRQLEDSLKEQDFDHIRAMEERLRLYQQTPDSPENKKTIPRLVREDLTSDLETIPCEKETIDGVTYVKTPLFTNGIVSTLFSFPANHVPLEDYLGLGLLGILLGSLSTEHYSYKELETKLGLYTGSLGFSAGVLDKKDGEPLVRLTTTLAHLPETTKDALHLVEEILFHTRFDDKKRIRDLLAAELSARQSMILPYGHSLAVSRLKSHHDKASFLANHLSDLDHLFALSDLLSHWEERADDFIASLEGLVGRIFQKKGLAVGITASEEDIASEVQALKTFLSSFPVVDTTSCDIVFTPENKVEVFTLPTPVHYVAMGGKSTSPYRGSMQVLANYLSTSYLHHHIRAKGGAYGAGLQISRQRNISTYSYRDPNLLETIGVYEKMAATLADLDLSEEDLTGLIIGSLNTFDPLLTSELKGALNLSHALTGYSFDDLARAKEEALETTVDELHSYQPVLEEAFDPSNLVVIGNPESAKVLASYHPTVRSLLSK